MRKEAVDPNAEAYWEDYFKDTGYGSALVKSVPRRIMAAVVADETRTAAVDGRPAPTVEGVRIKPLGAGVADGRLCFEGVLHATVNGRPAARAFLASVGRDGKLAVESRVV